MVYDGPVALGQAFVEVHADLTPFRRDLARELQRATRDFENQLNNVLQVRMQQTAGQAGRQAGQQFSDGFNQRVRRGLGEQDTNIWVSLAAALASALDDGISALPTEVKAALVAGVLAASPLISGALASLVTAGVALGFAGLGIALASQFERVQTRWDSFLSRTRLTLVNTAGAFEDALLQVFGLIEVRLEQLSPVLTRIFDTAATFVVPFTDQIFEALERFLNRVDDFFGQTGGFVDELGRSLITLAESLGLALGLLASTGEDGQKALRDLVAIVSSLIVGFAGLFTILTKVYGTVRDFAQFVSQMPILAQVLLPHVAVLGHVANATDDVSGANVAMFHTNLDVVDSQGRVITRTKEEEDALKKLAQAVKNAADATLNAITSNVSYEESIDNLQEALAEGGRNINITTETGRASVKAFATSISDLREQLIARVQTGELTTAQAVAQYNREIERIEELGNQAGVTDQQFYELFGTAIQLGELEIAPDTTGLENASDSTEALNRRLRELIALAQHLSTVTILGGIAGARRVPGFADGDIITHPTLAMLGEGSQPEVVIPLTKPARAAELMRQTGLDQMGGTQVLVFIDGQQMEARMVHTAQQVSARQGLALAQGFRGL